jgi:Ras-related protein Rab-5C
MAPIYYQGADAACIVYDMTSAQSFQEVDAWLCELRAKGPACLVVVLIGNKCEIEDRIQVSKEQVEDYGKANDIRLVKRRSVLTGDNREQGSEDDRPGGEGWDSPTGEQTALLIPMIKRNGP